VCSADVSKFQHPRSKVQSVEVTAYCMTHCRESHGIRLNTVESLCRDSAGTTVEYLGIATIQKQMFVSKAVWVLSVSDIATDDMSGDTEKCPGHERKVRF
jgi:hypothetical protein